MTRRARLLFVGLFVASVVHSTIVDPLARFRGSAEYGSSSFGTWSSDDFSLPVYTFSGAEDAPGRIGPGKEPVIHHRVGNDRLEAVVFTNGDVSVRQDEGGPKLLNAYYPEKGQYRGGFGYVIDNAKSAIILSTRVPATLTPDIKTFKLQFGVNYALKVTWNENMLASQRIFAPFGDLPFVYSQVNITNTGSTPLDDVSYVEYWAAKKQQLNCRHEPEPSFLHDLNYVMDPAHNFRGLQDHVKLNTTVKGSQQETNSAASYDDHYPRTTFLNSFNYELMSGYGTNGSAFFGDGGPSNPNITNGLDSSLNITDDHAIMSLATRFALQPNETKILCFTYGYMINDSQTLFGPPVVNATAEDCLAVFQKTQQTWWAAAPTMNFPGQLDWVQRELTWHNYMLRAGLTFDSFYDEHILNQNGNYLYVDEEQAAARDPLTHVLGLLYGHGPQHPLVGQGTPSGVDYVKEVIRYTLKEKRADGSIPWGQCAFGIDGFTYLDPSDLELQVLFTAMNYILARNDFEFLDELVVWSDMKKTIGEMLWESYEHLINVIRFGQHGLILLHTADHNDGILSTLGVEGINRTVAEKMGESVMNSALGAYTLTLYSEVLNYTGRADNASTVLSTAESLREAIDKTWTGRWYKRVWLGNESMGLGWRGDEQDGVMWTETQSWSILGGIPQLRLNRTTELVETIFQLVIKPSPIAAINAGPNLMSDKGKGYGGNEVFSIRLALFFMLT
jgi:hypothetical protein